MIRHLLTFGFFIFLVSPAQADSFTRTQVLMGDIPVSITVQTSQKNRNAAYQAMDKAFQEARRLESLLSEWRFGSDASRLNQEAGGRWIKISPEMVEILKTASAVSAASHGAFDITFASKSKRINYQDVTLDEKKNLARLKKHGARIGVSGIAKGYIVHRMSDMLKAEGFDKNLVNAGGDIYAAGKWKIGIRTPAPRKPGMFTVKNKAVSTSGTYERGNHLFDPRTGKPVNPHRSTTIIAPDGAQADALATAAFILKTDQIEDLLKRFPGTRAVTID